MACECFYLMSSKGFLTTFAASPDLFEKALSEDLYGPESGREIHRHLLYGDSITKDYPTYIHFPVIYRQIDGKLMRDVLDMRFSCNEFLISDRMELALNNAGLTGWRTYPILLFDRRGQEIRGYNGFTVTGRGGVLWSPVMLEDGSIVDREHIVWDESQWDGSDIFWIKPNCVVVTAKVREVVKKEKIQALSFNPLNKLAMILKKTP